MPFTGKKSFCVIEWARTQSKRTVKACICERIPLKCTNCHADLDMAQKVLRRKLSVQRKRIWMTISIGNPHTFVFPNQISRNKSYSAQNSFICQDCFLQCHNPARKPIHHRDCPRLHIQSAGAVEYTDCISTEV